MDKDNMALFNIEMAMEKTLFLRICRAISVKKACDILMEEFYGDLKVRKVKLQTLSRDIENIKM